MLRLGSRAVTSKQTTFIDHSNHSYAPPEKPTKPTSFFFNSPKIFKGFLNYNHNINPMMSSISILDTNPFSILANFLVFDNKPTKTLPKPSKNQHFWEQSSNNPGIGLALVDENAVSKQNKRKLVVFGSQLRIQVPISSVFPCFSPESPKEFGIKTPRNNLWCFGNPKNSNTQVHNEESFPGSRIPGNESLLMSDIDEDSEDYTCVVSHGPNPKTIHIFGNCVVESCAKIVGSPSFSSKRNGNVSFLGNSIPSQDDFLSFCYHCKNKLCEGKDIYMYRGEKAFCSEECRCQEMLFDEVEN